MTTGKQPNFDITKKMQSRARRLLNVGKTLTDNPTIGHLLVGLLEVYRTDPDTMLKPVLTDMLSVLQLPLDILAVNAEDYFNMIDSFITYQAMAEKKGQVIQ